MDRKVFSDPYIKALKVTQEEGRKEFFDLAFPQFGLRVSWTGRKVWFLYYRMGGDRQRKRHDIGTFPTMGLSDARAAANLLKGEIDKGNDPAEEKRAIDDAPTFEQLAAEYIERHAKINKRTWKKDQDAIKKDLLPAWKRKKAQDIKKRDVIAVLDTVAARAPIQANRTLALIRVIFNWALSRDLVEHNPCLQVRAPSPENERDRVLNEAELRAVWKAFETLGKPMGQAFKLQLLTAQRSGEIATMAWADVEMASSWWTIPAEKSKNGLAHRVPLSAMARAVLEEMRDADPVWVFPSPARKGRHIVKPYDAARRVATLTKPSEEEPGVEFVLHDLRRTAASYMTSMGFDRLKYVAKILNHVETGVTRVYDRHSYDAEKREALDAWAERLKVILSSKEAR